MLERALVYYEVGYMCYTCPVIIVGVYYICFYKSCCRPSFVAPVVIVYDGMSFPCSDDGCTSDADSEVDELWAILGPNSSDHHIPDTLHMSS